MNFSKIILLTFAGAAAVMVAKKLLIAKNATSKGKELLFENEFIEGSRRIIDNLPEHIDHNWFKLLRYHEEEGDAMFI